MIESLPLRNRRPWCALARGQVLAPALVVALVVALVGGLVLCGCGDAESPAPEPGAESGSAQQEPAAPAGPEVFEEDRFFVHVGPEGNATLTFGRHEQQGELLAAGLLAGEERGTFLTALREGMARVIAAADVDKPVLMLIAGPQTPWSHVGPILALASEPEVDLRRLDLRLPWDQRPQSIDLAPPAEADPPLEIDVLPATAPARADVRIGKKGVFLLYDGATEEDKVRHRESITALRAALQGYASTWKGKERRARIRVVTTPAPEPAYIHVLAVARVCREKRFNELSFVLEETTPGK